MATEFLNSLRGLSQFLSQEVQEARTQEKEQRIESTIGAAAQRFKDLEPDASESDIRSALYDSIENASLLGTSTNTMPLISSMFAQEMQQLEKTELKAQDQALAAALGMVSGKDVSGLSGQGAASLLQLSKPQLTQSQYQTEDGKSYMKWWSVDSFTQQFKEVNEVPIQTATFADVLNRSLTEIRAKAQVAMAGRDMRYKPWGITEDDKQVLISGTSGLPVYVNEDGTETRVPDGTKIYNKTTEAADRNSQLGIGKVNKKELDNLASSVLTAYEAEIPFDFDYKDYIKGSSGSTSDVLNNISKDNMVEDRIAELRNKGTERGDQAASYLENSYNTYIARKIMLDQEESEMKNKPTSSVLNKPIVEFIWTDKALEKLETMEGSSAEQIRAAYQQLGGKK